MCSKPSFFHIDNTNWLDQDLDRNIFVTHYYSGDQDLKDMGGHDLCSGFGGSGMGNHNPFSGNQTLPVDILVIGMQRHCGMFTSK